MDLASHCLLFIKVDVNNSVLTLQKMVKSKPTIIVFDDAYRVMPTRKVQIHYLATKPITIVVNIILADRATTFRELNIGTC
jgi:hypothetical protein